MADLDDVYNLKILEFAADIQRSTRLLEPLATASAHSKLCGSTVTIDLNVSGEKITDFGQTVKACLLGQAAASIVGREIVGTQIAEFRIVADQMRAMLKKGGEPPEGRWRDLATLQPVKDYPHRHASTLLVFEAIEKALAQLSQPSSETAAKNGGEAGAG